MVQASPLYEDDLVDVTYRLLEKLFQKRATDCTYCPPGTVAPYYPCAAGTTSPATYPASCLYGPAACNSTRDCTGQSPSTSACPGTGSGCYCL
ncbi:unnamed protein product, partial [Rotaria sp. Silwood1]